MLGKEIRAVVESTFMVLLSDLQSPLTEGWVTSLAREVCETRQEPGVLQGLLELRGTKGRL